MTDESAGADMPAADAPAADTPATEAPAETEPAAVDWRSDWSDPSRNSAVKVQAMARGKSARALVADRKAQKRYSEHSHAARVQAAQRGKAARTRVKQLRNSAAAGFTLSGTGCGMSRPRPQPAGRGGNTVIMSSIIAE